MAPRFKSVVLMGRSQTEGVVDTLNALISYLKVRDIEILLEQEAAKILQRNDLPIVERGDLRRKCELVIVVGGDGSLLSAGRVAVDQGLPVVGVNRGKLGFLTDILPDELDAVGKILEGEYIEEKRFLLEAIVEAEDKALVHEVSLNDVVLLPSEVNRMLEFSVYIDKKFVCHHRADGMIIATPTGSTAHALSGGGPILHPSLNAVVLLPMFPHTLSSRPIVVAADSEIEIAMAGHCKATPNISCDGQELLSVPDCGIIKIKKYKSLLRLIHLKNYNYYATLRSKLHWESK